MKKLLAPLALLLAPALAACSAEAPPAPSAPTPDAEGWTAFGAPFEPGEPAELSAALAAKDGAELVVGGRAERVCQASGCWVDLVDDGAATRVELRNADGSIFSLPKDCAGDEVVAKVVVERGEDGVTLVASGARVRPAGE